MSGDSKKGQEVAQNLCNTYGTSKEDAIGMASSWMQNLMMGQK